MNLVRRLARFVRNRGRELAQRARIDAVSFWPWLLERRNRRLYRELSEEELRCARRSDTAFVFGSGNSLNEISPGEWEQIARHVTIGFNYWSRQRWVRTDYHVIGEISSRTDHRRADWVPAVREYASLMVESPFYRDTILGLQHGWSALQSNRLVAMALLRPGTRVFRYRRIGRGVLRAPSRSLREGLVLGTGSLVACVNLACILGCKRIVLAGVDLYDQRYFWLAGDALRAEHVLWRGVKLGDPHHAAERTTEYLGHWAELLLREGIELSTYNKHSLLTRVMPVYARLPGAAAGQ